MQRARLAGILAFSAGCLMIVLSVLKPGNDAVRIGLGGVLIAFGLFWLGPPRKNGRKK